MSMSIRIKRLVVVSAMGIGLGLGVTISVISPRSNVQAVPQQSTPSYGVSIESIQIGSSDEFSVTVQPSVSRGLQQLSSSGLGSRSSIVLSGAGSSLYEAGSEATLGTSVTVLGSNNGIYSYSVTQVLSRERGQAKSLMTDTKDELIIALHRYPWDTTELVLIASYRQ